MCLVNKIFPQRDIDEVDIALPVHIKDILNQFFIVVGLIFILSFVSPVVLAVIVPLVLLFIFIQTAYLRSSRQLKRLAAVNRLHSDTFRQGGEKLSCESCPQVPSQLAH